MSQCCDANGFCTGGHGCPIPQNRIPTYTASAEVQGGNVWFAEPEPPEPLTTGERVTLVAILLASACVMISIIAFVTGYNWTSITRWLSW